MYRRSREVIQVRQHLLQSPLHLFPHLYLQQVPGTVKLDRGAGNPIQSDIVDSECESSHTSCIDIPNDNLDHFNATTNVQILYDSEQINQETAQNTSHNQNYNMTREKSPAPTVEMTASTKPTETFVTHLTRNPLKLDKETWENYNTEFITICKDSWSSFKKGILCPEQYISNLNAILASFLELKPEFQKHTKEYFKHNPINDKPLEEMRHLKVNLNKEAKNQDATDAVKEQAKQSIRTYSHRLKVHKEKKEASCKENKTKAIEKTSGKLRKM